MPKSRDHIRITELVQDNSYASEEPEKMNGYLDTKVPKV